MHYILLAFLVAFLWATNKLLAKSLLNHMSPELMMCVVSGIITVVGVIYLALFKRDQLIIPNFHNNRVGILVLLAAIFGYFIPGVLLFHLIKDHPIHIVVSISASYPVILLLLLCIIGKQKIDIRGAIGVIMIVIGVILCVISSENK